MAPWSEHIIGVVMIKHRMVDGKLEGLQESVWSQGHRGGAHRDAHGRLAGRKQQILSERCSCSPTTMVTWLCTRRKERWQQWLKLLGTMAAKQGRRVPGHQRLSIRE